MSLRSSIDEAALKSTLALLSVVATDLETLTLVGNVIADFSALPVFLVLRELTHGGQELLFTSNGHFDILRPFPNLKRLLCYSSETTHIVVDALAPQLTHLRISEASGGGIRD